MQKVYAWRLAKAKYRESALDGVGSALGGGRWNSVGTPVVYCASTLALAVLEVRVHTWGINKKSKDPKLAFELIKELNSLETQKAIAAVGDAVPGLEAATEIPEFKTFPKNSHIFYECLSHAKPVPSPANYTEMEGIFMRQM